jgi:hypothetical protein
MMKLGGSKDVSPEAKDYVLDQLNQLADELKSRTDPDRLTSAFYRQSAREIQHYLSNPEANAPNRHPRVGQRSALALPGPAGAAALMRPAGDGGLVNGYNANINMVSLGFAGVVMVTIELTSQAEHVLAEF